jgi:hypothetical protein
MHLDALIPDGGGTSTELSGRRARIMSRLRVELNHHPATTEVRLAPTRDGNDSRLVAELDTKVLVDGLVDAEEAKLVVNWWTQPPGYEDQFTFHYVESTGYDCGWHRQPHPDESKVPFDHFQQRASPDDEYEYLGVDFREDTPAGLLWAVTTTRLERIIRSRYDPEFEP